MMGEEAARPSDAVVLAAAITRLAESIDHLAVSAQAVRLSGQTPAPQGAQMPPVAGPGTSPPAASGGTKTPEEKMGAKVFAICTQNGWDIPSVGEQVTGHAMNRDSRKWTKDDLGAVLDQFKEWGFS